MRQLGRWNKDRGKYDFKITTSKIRGFLSLVNDVYNEEYLRQEETLQESSLAKIQMMRVRILYEAGRYDDSVKPFVEKSCILSYLKGIGNSRTKFLRFAAYMEALVGYHRYLGGKDVYKRQGMNIPYFPEHSFVCCRIGCQKHGPDDCAF